MSAIARKTRETYPVHDYADQHTLFKARAALPPRRRLRDASTLRSSGEVACERIREFAWDVSAELRAESPNRWMATIAREVLGLNERTGYDIISGNRLTVSTATVDAVHLATGIPLAVFYDSQL